MTAFVNLTLLAFSMPISRIPQVRGEMTDAMRESFERRLDCIARQNAHGKMIRQLCQSAPDLILAYLEIETAARLNIETGSCKYTDGMSDEHKQMHEKRCARMTSAMRESFERHLTQLSRPNVERMLLIHALRRKGYGGPIP